MNDTLLTALALIPALVIAIVFHEVAHGWTALMLGDPTARERRRLSLNPIRHVDPFGTLILPGLLALTGAPVFGWAKPVPVSKDRLDNPRFGMMAVAIAGPATNLVLATLGAVALGLLTRSIGGTAPGLPEFAVSALYLFILINVFLALFNLLPVPPFDGSHIVEGLLPRSAARVYARLRPFGFLLIVLLLLVIPWFFPGLGVVQRFVLPPVLWAQDKYLVSAQAGEGPDVFRAEIMWVAQFAELGLLREVTYFITDEDRADFLPNTLASADYDGDLWGLPQVTDCLALLYNRAMFEAAGVAPPAASDPGPTRSSPSRRVSTAYAPRSGSK